MEGEGSGVFRSSNRAEEGRNAEGEGRRSLKLANTEEYKRGAKVSRTCQLLQVIYERLCEACSTTTCVS